MLPLFKGPSCKFHTALLLMSHWPELSHIVSSRARRLGNVGFVLGGYVPQVKSGALLLWKRERMYLADN